MNTSSLVVIGSEVALALYPILIKKVPTNLVTQLLSRFLTFTVLAAVLASPADLKGTWGSIGGAGSSVLLGALTFIHVTVSYVAFRELPAGVAMSLFYTYPIMNLIAGVLFLGESVTALQVGLMILAFIGVVLISRDTKEGEGFAADAATAANAAKPLNWRGVVAAIAAAATETAMYFAVKSAARPDPYFAVLQLYPGAMISLAAVATLLSGSVKDAVSSIDLKGSVWLPLLLFNAVIGFIGYALRFWAIPKMSTAVFSLLTFFGVVASFGWGWLFVGESPTVNSAIGALCISIASAAARP